MQSYSRTINHFSHSHSLDLVYAPDRSHTDHSPLCSACKTRASGWTYACSRRCSFFIHAWCALLPQVITHPGHHRSSHRLTLLSAPAHPSGSFKCDGCGCNGEGFSYRCTTTGCDYDLHAVCAARPLNSVHRSHDHQLSLTFGPPYSSGAFKCDLCGAEGANHWLYRCGSCEFDAHLGCVAGDNQSAHPSPSWPPRPEPGFGVGGRARPGGLNYNQPPATAPPLPYGALLMNTAAEGVVEGAAQQAGQLIINSMTGGGGGDTNLDAGDTFPDLFGF